MSASKSRLTAIAKWSAVPAGLVLSAALVWQASNSAFTATTTNPTSNWATGSVVLGDDDGGTAIFNAGTLVPGATGTKCIVVTSSGTLPATVKLYGTAPATTLALSSYLDLNVAQGTGGTFNDCTGFVADPGAFAGTLAAFGTTYTNHSNGFGTFAPGGGTVTKTYKITYTLNASTPNSAQGGTASIGLTWESQNS